MKFHIFRTCSFLESQKLVNVYPALSNYGLHDEVDNGDKIAYVNIASMAKLRQLVKEIKQPVIIECNEDGEMTLEIYDDYRE